MKTLVEIKTRETEGRVEIIMPNGTIYRISFQDKKDMITVQTPDGALIIQPSVSNEVRISNAETFVP